MIYLVLMLSNYSKNGQFILWQHLRDLKDKLSTMTSRSTGQTLLPKLKQEHVDLSSHGQMRVDLAAQVGVINLFLLIYIVYCCKFA